MEDRQELAVWLAELGDIMRALWESREMMQAEFGAPSLSGGSIAWVESEEARQSGDEQDSKMSPGNRTTAASTPSLGDCGPPVKW